MEMTEQEMFQAFDEYDKAMRDHYEAVEKSIKQVIEPLGDNAMDDFAELTECCGTITGKIEFVDGPLGDHQPGDANETFVDVYVSQRTGHLGDDFYGEVFAQLKDGRWIRIPYEC